LSVLTQTHGLEIFDRFTSPDLRQNSCFLVVQLRGNDEQDGATYDFLSPVAENVFGSPVPTGHDAIEIFADNAILGGLDDGCQWQRRFLGPLSLGDVHVDAGHPQGLSRLISEDLPFCGYPMNTSVRPDHAPLTLNGTLDFIRCLYQLQDIASVVRMN